MVAKNQGDTLNVKGVVKNGSSTSLNLHILFSYIDPTGVTTGSHSDMATLTAGGSYTSQYTVSTNSGWSPGTWTVRLKLSDNTSGVVYDTKDTQFTLNEIPMISAFITDIRVIGRLTAEIDVVNDGNQPYTFYVGSTLATTVNNPTGYCDIWASGNIRDQNIVSFTLQPGETRTAYLTFTSMALLGDYLIVKVWKKYPDLTVTPSDCLDGWYTQV